MSTQITGMGILGGDLETEGSRVPTTTFRKNASEFRIVATT